MHGKKKRIAGIAWLLVLGCLLLQTGFAQEKAAPAWTPALCMQFSSVQGTAISPDGSLVAYVVRKPVMEGEKSEYLSHIWLASADGKMNFQLTQGEKSCTSPAFSPDGKWLAFASARKKKTQIWLIRVNGGEAEQLTEVENGVGGFAWSPDGKKIAYTRRDPETEAEKKAKKEKRDVILVDRNFKYSHLYTVEIAADAEGKHKTQRLTAGKFHITAFDWAPAGGAIVFSHQPDPRINTGFSESDISTVPADSGAVTPLVSWKGSDRSPHYSPDGKWIAFTSHGGTPQEIGLQDMYVIPAAGGTPRKLADTPDRNAQLVGWDRASSQVYFMEAVHTRRQMFALPLDGKSPVQITRGDGVYGSVAVARKADRFSFAYQNLTTPAEAYVSGLTAFDMRKLSELNGQVPLPPMGKTRLLSWKSGDGLEIEGLLTLPVNYRSGQKVPLILNVHGGPAGMFGQSFTGNPSIYMIQFFAQKGYAVLRPNPRGSTGYGKDFRFANFRDWGYGDFDDLMAGVDKVIEMGIAHPDSLCLMGWSYGGYMTSFAVTRTTRFKAASMGAGLPNLVSMVSTTDIPNYLVAHMGGEFWNDYATYEKHSAIYHIKNVKTPTQVLHGARDLRVPTTQGQEFYTALSRMGVPTEMILYPRTPHGPREPKLLMDVSPRILAWFEKYLGRVAKSTD